MGIREMFNDLGKEIGFLNSRYGHLDTEAWPGRELKWVWCHPILSFVLFVTFLGTVSLYLSGV